MLLMFIVFSGCTRKEKDNPILAKIGGRTITVNEFKYRSEFTVRPKYLSKKGYELNKILLDNLLAEKIFAIEAGDTCRMARNELFNSYIQGIQEQNMREELYFKAAYDKVKADTNEIKRIYRFAGREYRVAFYTLLKDELAQKITKRIAMGQNSANAAFDELGGGKKEPEQNVSWKEAEQDPIFDALFTHPVKQDTVIGPLRLGKNYYVIMKVLDWKDQIFFGEDALKRWNDSAEKVKQRKAMDLWNGILEKRMLDKSIDFNPPVFRKLADLAYTLYAAQGDSQKKDIAGDFFGKKGDVSQIDMFGSEETFLKSPFMTFDGKTWTVEEFRNGLAIHPLVYRTKNFTKQNFPQEFRKAVADWIRDRCLTQEAYANNLQKKDSVKRNTLMWRDAMIASWERDERLSRLAKKHHIEGQADKLTKVYNAYMDSLMKAYSGSISINTEELKKIELTGSDMVAFKQGVPYPYAVPAFREFIIKY